MRFIFGCLAVITLAGCQSPPKSCCQKTMTTTVSAPGVSSNSIYHLDATWQDENGKNFHLADLRGRPVVISMFFATCQGVCIITKDDMKMVDASLPAAVRQRTAFVLVTLDPVRDSAADLKDYLMAQSLSPGRWHLLRGTAADTARLATMLGIGYGHDHTGLFRHSSEVIVLDASGKIVSWQDGIHADLAKTVQTLSALP